MDNKPSPLLPYEVAELTPRTPIWLRAFCFVLQAAAVCGFIWLVVVIAACVGGGR